VAVLAAGWVVEAGCAVGAFGSAWSGTSAWAGLHAVSSVSRDITRATSVRLAQRRVHVGPMWVDSAISGATDDDAADEDSGDAPVADGWGLTGQRRGSIAMLLLYAICMLCEITFLSHQACPEGEGVLGAVTTTRASPLAQCAALSGSAVPTSAGGVMPSERFDTARHRHGAGGVPWDQHSAASSADTR